jgi:ionotropic glutamate receptor NMDA 2B
MSYIVNLHPKIGLWKSWLGEGDKALNIRDIVWPGGAPIPPDGVPEKFHLRITFMEEPPYVNMGPPDSQTGKCSANRGVPCRIAPEFGISG